ncbi:MAG: glycosyltransferase [Candidatus Sericytochromatia bacterium]|nr:glycosyltransferase [Candidatus Sericytochromatia bacterium]
MSVSRTTVVIVNWNTCELLLACLESLLNDRPDVPVVVVDNASSDETMALGPLRYPQVTWLPQTRNLGFAAGNNVALRHVYTDFVWLLNPDTVVRPGALAALEACLDATPDAAIVGPALWNLDGTPQACAFRFPTVRSTVAEWARLPRYVALLRDVLFRLKPVRKQGPVDWVLGAAMLVRMRAVTHVGGLCEGYFMYAEELDWCRRFKEAGWRVLLDLQADVVHLGGGATSQVREAMLRELFRSRGQYLARFSSPSSEKFFRWGMRGVARWNAFAETVRPRAGWTSRLPLALAQSACDGWNASVASSGEGQGDTAPSVEKRTEVRICAVVITRNEARRLPGCLESLRRAPVITQIVVVDDGSSDDTVEVARAVADVVVEHRHTGENWDLNKNVGMALAQEPWVLLIDADERLTEKASQVLAAALRVNAPEAGFWLPRAEWYFGRWARHASSDSRVMRLFRRGAATFSGTRLHAHPEVTGPVGFLPAWLRHEAYVTLSEYIAKTSSYTDHEARVRSEAGERGRFSEIWTSPARHFWYRFIRLRGYRDGWFGLYYSGVTALYPCLERIKLWSLCRRL